MGKAALTSLLPPELAAALELRRRLHPKVLIATLHPSWELKAFKALHQTMEPTPWRQISLQSWLALHGWPPEIPSSLSAFQRWMLSLSHERWEKLLLASGLHLMGTPGYLMLKTYREVLSAQLTPAQMEKLIHDWPGKAKALNLALKPEQLVQQAQEAALQAMSLRRPRDLVWQLIALTFPKPEKLIREGAVPEWWHPHELMRLEEKGL